MLNFRSAVFLAACLWCSAQQESPVFRTGTTLVEFTVVAVDGKGNPVTDLKKEELQVTAEGKPRELAFFRFEGEIAVGPPKALPPGVSTNRSEYTAGPPRNITAILVDAINTPPGDQASARDQVMAYLRTLSADTRVAVYGIGQELVVLHDFTNDVASLKANLPETMKKFPLFVSQDVIDLECFAAAFRPVDSSEVCGSKVKDFLRLGEMEASATTVMYQALAKRRQELTLAWLETLGDHLAGIPGRKNLIWIGGGVPILSITGVQKLANVHSGFQSYETQIRRTAQRLASQGIAIYPVDSLGLMRGMPARPQKSPLMQVLANLTTNYDSIPAMNIMASVTGGRVVKGTNDLALGMKAAATDVRGTYSIGFYAAMEPDNKWHGLDVKTTRRGVRLAYRQGYRSEAAVEESLQWTEERWRKAIANPLGSNAIHLDARIEAIPGAEAGAHGLLLNIEAADLQLLKVDGKIVADVDIAVADKDPTGGFSFRVETVKLTLAPETLDVRYRYRWKMASGTSVIRLIVRDRGTGRFGTLDVPIK